jgi:putative thioredoxin
MTASEFIVDVTEADFEYEVLAYSNQVPVVVDFWAEWCVPCKVLGPLLEKLAREANGAFRLAKINVDQNFNLARRFNVSGIPAVKAFRNGAVVAEFTGALPEPKVREFLRSIAPSPLDLAVEKGLNLLKLGQPEEAEEAFQTVLDEIPEHPVASLGMLRSLLVQRKVIQALSLLRDFPASKQYASAESMRPLAEGLARAERGELEEFSDNPLDAAFARAFRLIQRGNLPAAMDGLLEILRQDKRYKNGAARQVLLGIFEMLGDEDELTREYRSELATVLF